MTDEEELAASVDRALEEAKYEGPMVPANMIRLVYARADQKAIKAAAKAYVDRHNVSYETSLVDMAFAAGVKAAGGTLGF